MLLHEHIDRVQVIEQGCPITKASRKGCQGSNDGRSRSPIRRPLQNRMQRSVIVPDVLQPSGCDLILSRDVPGVGDRVYELRSSLLLPARCVRVTQASAPERAPYRPR